MNFVKRIMFVVAALCIWASLSRAQAVVNEGQETAVLYVDVVNGNDSNPGTQALPLQHIAAAVAAAEANNLNSIGTHVYINPGLYRENIVLWGNGEDTALPETFDAVTPGTVLISGADQYTNWTQTSGNHNVYSTPWTYNFGVCPPLLGAAPPEPDINLRREMAFINGAPLQQVLTLGQMLEGTFYVDDAGQQFYIWPPSGTNLSTADVELGDRGQLWSITRKNGVVLRGLTFEYSADCVSGGALEVDFGPNQNIEIDGDSFLWNNATGLHLFQPLTNYTVKNVVANHNGAVGINAFESVYGLWQNNTADYNNWRGEQATYYDWGAAGINNYGDANDTLSNITTDWNIARGIHWDTNLENINASNIISRNNLHDGVFFERNTGPLNATQIISCNNSNPALLANGASSTAGGISLRDSENVTLTNSFVYGNGNTQFNVLGIAGGIPILNWQTGQIITVFSENFISTGNIFESTDPTQNTLRDSYLNGDDWTLFQSTLTSANNTWWNSSTGMSFVLPVPTLGMTTDFPGWQAASLQDQTSTFSQPSGNPQSQCQVSADGPDLWVISTAPQLTLDPSGQAASTYTYIPMDGFNSTLNLTMDGISEIPGASATLTPTVVPDGSGSSVFSLTSPVSIAPGTYQFTVLANGGSTTRAATAFLYVPQTSLRFSPSMTLNFGSVQQGQESSRQTLTINNFGTAPVNNLTIGTAPAGFLVNTTCGSTLAAGASCNVNITFAPNAGIPYSYLFNITDSDPTSPQTVTLNGTGIAAATLTQSAYTLTYGSVVYGLNAQQAVTLTNTGTVTASISPASFSGAGASSYSQTNNCGTSLTAGSSCSYTITFDPQALGQIQATLTIPDNTLGGSNTVTVTGTGETAVTVNPLALTFGTVSVGNNASRTTTITNAGNALPVTFGFSDSADYSEADTCGGTVPAMGSCTVTVTFAPQSAGTLNGTFSITDSDPASPQVVSLTATGVAPITTINAAPVKLTFGNAPWGTSWQKTVTLTNNGRADALFTSFTFTDVGASDYSQTNNCAPFVVPQGTCIVTVTFTPKVLGSLLATLTITDNNTTGSNVITLTGTGITSVTVKPTSLPFGTVVMGYNSTKTATLTNAGNALPVTIKLADTVNYSETDTCGGVVPAMGSCVISVTFAPQSSGTLNTTLRVTDADPSSPQTVTITGTGVANITTLTLTPSSLSYNNVVWGLAISKTVKVQNTGTVDATIGAFTFSGAHDYTQTNNCPSALMPNKTCTITVTFAPNTLGALNGSVSFADNTREGSSTITMTGTGVTSVQLAPAKLSFGSVEEGYNSTKTTTLTNLGNALPVTISLADTVDYSETNTCGGEVPAKGSCVITVTFAPQSAGILNTTLSIVDADPSSPQAVAITGKGLSNLTTVTATPSALTFNPVIWGLSAAKIVTVKNQGVVNAMIGAFTFSGAADYTQTNNCPANLAPQATCTITVTFAPNAIGELDGSLSFTDNTTAGSNTINMTGTGKTSISISPIQLLFGKQKVGTNSAPLTTTFTNSGNAIAVTISLGGTDPQDWSYTTTCTPIVPANSSCTVSATFSPLVQGSLGANVQFSDADPNPTQLTAMTGSGS
jgi:hypothetical protein